MPAQIRAFKDTWRWDKAAVERTEPILNATAHPAHKVISGLYAILGESGMLAYLTYMTERLLEMRRLLKPTGSIYLHCDPTASHYLKVVMDAIFGKGSFRNEIVWCYSRPSAPKQRQLSRVHDIVFWYSRSSNWTFNPDSIRQPYASSSREREGYAANASKVAEGTVQLDSHGKFPESWIYIPPLKGNSKEYLGYPTQKPRPLLERIIKAGSNPGDLVLDPFAGCGTTIEAAQVLKRRWVGIDISSFAIDLVQEYRLKPLGVVPTIEGIPADLASARRLAREKPFDFETWAIYLVPGLAPNARQTGDGGIDGRGKLLIGPDKGDSQLVLAQVKSSFSISQFRDFIHVLNREQAALGVFITIDAVSSPSARAEIAKLGKVVVGASPYPRVGLWSIEDYFQKLMPPHLPPMLDPFTGKPMTQPGLPQPTWPL